MNQRHSDQQYASRNMLNNHSNGQLNLVGDRLLCSKDSRLLTASNAQLHTSASNTNLFNVSPTPNNNLLRATSQKQLASRTMSHNHISVQAPRSPRPAERRATLDSSNGEPRNKKKHSQQKQPVKDKKSSGLFGLFGKKSK